MAEEDLDLYLNKLERQWRKRLESRRTALRKRMENEGLNPDEKPGPDNREPKRLVDGCNRINIEIEELEHIGRSPGRRERLLRFVREKQIQGMIRTHSISGMVAEPFLGQQEEDERLYIGFRAWDSNEQKERIRDLARIVYIWLEAIKNMRVKVMPNSDSDWIYWRNCFIRRLHGEYIVGDLMPRMNLTCVESPQEGELLWNETEEKLPGYHHSNAWTALEGWVRALLLYWEGSGEVFDILKDCPVLRPLRKLNEDRDELKEILGLRHEFLVHALRHLRGDGNALRARAGVTESDLFKWIHHRRIHVEMETKALLKGIETEEDQAGRDKPEAEEESVTNKKLNEMKAKYHQLRKEARGLDALGRCLASLEKRIEDKRELRRIAENRLAALEVRVSKPEDLKNAQCAVNRSKEELGEAEKASFYLLERAIRIRLFCEIPRAKWLDFRTSPTYGADQTRSS
ncbi:MAG: hypothetical protein GY719_42665 [bacterium]|nr:hypothetical protein [bacterium]